MNQFAKRVFVALALCFVIVQSVAIAQNLGAAPQVNVAVQGSSKVLSDSHALDNDEAECERDKNSFNELIHVRLTSMRLAFRPSSALGLGKKSELRQRSYRNVEAE